MKKIFIAGFMAACVMMAGMTASAAGRAVPRCVRDNGVCHQQLNAVWKDCVRHDCTYVDADGDGFCDNCSWQEERHHCVDEDGYCLNGTCSYDNCGYAYGTGYCRGYCSRVPAEAGAAVPIEAASGAALSQEEPSSGTADADRDMTGVSDIVQGRPAAQDDTAAAWGNGSGAGAGSGSGAGAGNGSGYNGGYWGYSHHGSGHHGGHHGCR